MERVIAEKTDGLNAMGREDVEPISFYWGKEERGKKFKGGSGVAHLIAHRNAQGLDGTAIAKLMPEVIAYSNIYKRRGENTEGERFFIGHNGYTAILSLYKMGNRETWLLTGWLDDAPDAQSKGYDSESATNTDVTLSHINDGAEAESNIKPIGADGKALQNQTSPRGATRIYPESYLIKFFDGANLSTLLHETGHVFFEKMERWSG